MSDIYPNKPITQKKAIKIGWNKKYKTRNFLVDENIEFWKNQLIFAFITSLKIISEAVK